LLEYVDALFYPSEKAEIDEKIKAAMALYKDHPDEYQKIECLGNFSEEKLRKIDVQEQEEMDDFYKMTKSL